MEHNSNNNNSATNQQGKNSKNNKRRRKEATNTENAAGCSVANSSTANQGDVIMQDTQIGRTDKNRNPLSELLDCIYEGNCIKFEEILNETQIDLNQSTTTRKLFLHIANVKSQTQIVEILSKHGMSAKGACGSSTGASSNVNQGVITMQETQASERPPIIQNPEEIKCQLLRCIETGNAADFKSILEETQSDLNLYEPTADGRFFLHIAVTQNQAPIVELLLKQKSLLSRNIDEQLYMPYNEDETVFEWISKEPSRRHLIDLLPTKENRSGFLGNLYQLSILALLSLRSYNKKDKFPHSRLAMEVPEFGKFDDIVFKCAGSKLLIQLKYKSTGESIEKREIFPPGEKLKDFSLRKYFDSYWSLVEAGHNDIEDVMILTNTNLEDDCKEYFEDDPLDENHILNVASVSIKRLKIHESKVKLKKEKSFQKVSQTNFSLFCEKFHFVLNFPNEDEIRKLIMKEIGELFKLSNTEVADSSFFVEMENWFKRQVSPTITEATILEFYAMINQNLVVLQGVGLHKTNCDRLPRITFPELHTEFQSFIDSLEQKVLLIRTSCVPSTSKRIVDQTHLKFPNGDDFMFILPKNIIPTGSKSSQIIAEAIKCKDAFKVLIVACEKVLNFEELFSELNRNLNDRDKKIVFIIKGSDISNEDVLKFRNYFQNPRETDDDPSFNEFSTQSQGQFMDRGTIFERRNVGIGEILSQELVDEVFKPQTLYESLVYPFDIEIHSAWSFGSSKTYIQRKLDPIQTFMDSDSEPEEEEDDVKLPDKPTIDQNCETSEDDDSSSVFSFGSPAKLNDFKIFVEETQFYTPRPDGKVVVICGDPGVGKSSLLTSVQENMNKLDSNIWSIKLNLNDFAHNARKEYHFSRIDFTEDETEKSIEFLCKMVTCQKGKLSFSQRLTAKLLTVCLQHTRRDEERLPKVVLLFDGFDEIAPKYTEKVLCLMRSLNRTNLEQMWVSTRYHETDRITEGLVIKRLNGELKLSENNARKVKAILNKYNKDNEKGFKITLHNKQSISMSNKNKVIATYDIPKAVFNETHSIESTFVHYSTPKNVESFQLNLRLPKKIAMGSLDLVLVPDKKLEVEDFKKILDIFEIICSKDTHPVCSEINFREVAQYPSNSENIPKYSNGSLKYLLSRPRSFWVEISIDSNDSTILFDAKLSNTTVFNLLDPDESEQAEFLLKYCELYQKDIGDQKQEAQIKNVLTLLKIIRYDYDEYSKRLLKLFEFDEKKIYVEVDKEIEKNLETFLRTPLHLHMLAELAVKSQFKFSANIRLHQIYKELIALKEDIYLDDKQRHGDNADESRKASKWQALWYHRLMARSLLLNEKHKDLEEHLPRDQQMLYKFGITAYKDGQLEFVHRSFAEFFLACELWKNIEKEEIQKLLLETVLVEERFGFVRQFFDSLVSERNTFEGISIPVPRIQIENGKYTCLLRVCEDKNYNIAKLLLKTLEYGVGGCYELFKAERQLDVFIEILFKSSDRQICQTFSSVSTYNPHTLDCTSEILEEKWDKLDQELRKWFIGNTNQTYFDFKRNLFRKNEYGHYFHTVGLETEYDEETLTNIILHRNAKGETFLFERKNDKFRAPSYLSTLPRDLLQELIEACDYEGRTILFASKRMHHDPDSALGRVKNMSNFPEMLGDLCHLTGLSDDFIIITFFGNAFSISQSIERLLLHFEDDFSKCEESNQLRVQIQTIRVIIQRNEIDFEINLPKLNQALENRDLKEIEEILCSSRDFARELILACNYKQEDVLREPKIILKILKHLEVHEAIHHHVTLRLPFELIKFDYQETFEEIYLKVWEILLVIKKPSSYCFLIEYIWRSIALDRSKMLSLILNSIQTSTDFTVEDLVSYDDQIILRYDVDEDPKHEIRNSAKDILAKWISDHGDSFKDETIIEILSLSAKHNVSVNLDEELVRKKVSHWLGEVKSIARWRMQKIFFGSARFGFKNLMSDLVGWIEDKDNKLPFRLIDVLRLVSADRGIYNFQEYDGFLGPILECVENYSVKDEFKMFIRGKDSWTETFLFQLSSWNDIAKCIPFAIKEFGWEFVLSEKSPGITFVSEHRLKEYFPDILQILKDHEIDQETLKNILFSNLNQCAVKQQNFIKTIDFCLKNFPDKFEAFFIQNSEDENENDFFTKVLENKEWDQILHHLSSQCGKKYKNMVLGFIQQSFPKETSRTQRSDPFFQFVFEKYSEGDTNYESLFDEFEKFSFRLLQYIQEVITEEEWKDLFLSPTNTSFADVLKSALEKPLWWLLYSNLSGYGNVVHVAFKRGVGLKCLQLLPKKHLKDLLCEYDDYEKLPFHYSTIEENLNELVKFLSRNLNEDEQNEILEELGIKGNGTFADLIRVEIPKISETRPKKKIIGTNKNKKEKRKH